MVLYAYRTAVHASTGFSPFQLMYGRAPQFTGFSEPNAFDPTSYQAYLQAKLTEIRDFVETNLVEAAQRQKAQFDKHSKERSFGVGDPVWVSIQNLIHGGKGTGLSRPSRAHQPLKFLMQTNARWCISIGYVTVQRHRHRMDPTKRMEIRGCWHRLITILLSTTPHVTPCVPGDNRTGLVYQA